MFYIIKIHTIVRLSKEKLNLYNRFSTIFKIKYITKTLQKKKLISKTLTLEGKL